MPPFKFEERFPLQIVSELQTLLGLTTFVETGTGSGNTAGAAAKLFKDVCTVEIHEETYKRAKAAMRDFMNVHCYHGESVVALPLILEAWDPASAFCWLDGHYSGPGTGCGSTECPVLEELEIAMNVDNPAAVIAIDDLRFFTDTPPASHKAEDWPSLGQLWLVDQAGAYRWFTAGDTLFAVKEVGILDAWLPNHVLSKRIKLY